MYIANNIHNEKLEIMQTTGNERKLKARITTILLVTSIGF